MTRFLVLFAVMISLSACNGTNPFDEIEANTGTATTTPNTTTPDTSGEADNEPEDEGGPISSNTFVLPGTANPSASTAIFRSEARSEGSGNGYAEGFSYDAATDTFTVDNLAFDGDSAYTVVMDGGSRLGMGPFSVFEAPANAVDGLTSSQVEQLTYRALYAVSPDGNSSIAIVRTAAYINYGFGGFIYQRDGGVTLPLSGQALYTNHPSTPFNYGGLRDFEGQGGLEYVRGKAEIAIDFDDFNSGSAVLGTISERRIFDMNNVDQTNAILTALNNRDGGALVELPEIRFLIEGSGVINASGEMTGKVSSAAGGVFTDGKYYAVLSGNNAETITGIIVVTGADPRGDYTVRETGGFFAVRQ